jgi:hypothetical protein
MSDDDMHKIYNILMKDKYDKLYLRQIQKLFRHKTSLNELKKLNLNDLKEIRTLLDIKPSKDKFYLSGVRKFSYYTHSELDKKIYVLYDMHNNEGVCEYKNINRSNYITVTKWIEDAINLNEKSKDPKFIDVFIETLDDNIKHNAQFKEPVPGMFTDLSNVRSMLYNCTSSDKKYCEYKHARAHWVDPRRYFAASYNFFYDSHNDARAGYICHSCKNINNNILNNIVKYYEDVLETPRMKKQFDNMQDKTIERELRSFLIERIKYFQTEFNNYKVKHPIAESQLYDAHGFVSSEIKTTYLIYRFHLIAMTTVLIMDAYMLARLFRTFKYDSKNKFPVDVHNAIIYAGGIHATNYELFFQRLGFKEVFSVGDFTSDYNNTERYIMGYSPLTQNQDQCLDISNMPLPLFK